ncbi:MAG: prolipoprotein diacylglyceryl transferase [Paludibacteraceae bacterium]|nr:prolipoprotein diacylglyceryl transferase [Prevotellaceae bacterium]
MLSYITWTVDPDLFSFGSLTVRWYGLMWALGFFIGYMVESKIYKKEGLPDDAMDKLFIYMMIGTIAGARLGHCFFYDWGYYSEHLYKVLFIWEGGLSSHGGAFGILASLWLFHKRVAKKSYIWVLDRVVIAVAVCGACIRLGNLMNHEIYGHATDLPWAFRFITNIHAWQNGAEPIFSAPSHPTQIYEIVYCLVTFSVLLFLYWKTNARKYEGLLFGVFLIGIFLTRFLLEFIKNNQESFEDGMPINMGQILSVPFFLFGFYFVIKAWLKSRKSLQNR